MRKGVVNTVVNEQAIGNVQKSVSKDFFINLRFKK
jgi:hypothetical protein